jgi:hypothetical protein
VIYNTDTDCVQWYDGSFWYDGCSGLDGPDPLPGNITLEEISAYYIASALDDDYLDGSGALPTTTEAQLPGTAADDQADGATTETAIDIQGTLTTTGVTINIPYEVSSGSVDLTAFSQTITIPADYTENNTATDITFSYPPQTGLSGTGVIPATLQAVGSNLDVIQFDLNSGFGADYLGFLLGKFVYALDSAGTYADFEVRGIPGIPDKNIGDGVHDFVYILVISSPTGEVWLNYNLGADYANTSKSVYNVGQQAVASDDFHAYGSLFQWGRVADGHEIINWTSSTGSDGTEQSNETTTTSNIPIPNTSNFILSNNWYSGSNPDDLWQENTKTIYDPCPLGFRVPTQAEWQAEITDGGWSNATNAFNSDLTLTLPGGRRGDNGNLNNPSSVAGYRSSRVSGTDSRFLKIENSIAQMQTVNRATGFSVRCIQE